jgi:hypothetical protein
MHLYFEMLLAGRPVDPAPYLGVPLCNAAYRTRADMIASDGKIPPMTPEALLDWFAQRGPGERVCEPFVPLSPEIWRFFSFPAQLRRCLLALWESRRKKTSFQRPLRIFQSRRNGP